MKYAVTVLLAAGIKTVLASSFARTFYRNAINNGLLPLECDTSDLREGERLTVHFREGVGEISCAARTGLTRARPFPPFLLQIIQAGGLVPYLHRYGGFKV